MSQEELHPLPQEWVWTTLGEVCQLDAGGPAPQGKEYFQPRGYPFVRVQDLGRLGNRVRVHETKDYITDAAASRLRLFPQGAVLFTKSGMSTLLNQRAILGREMYVVSHIGVAVPQHNIPSAYIYYWLKTVDFGEIAHATTLPSLPLSKVKDVRVPLPPLAEQQRIVAEIEKQFTRLDAAVAALKRSQANLKRYRASVLKAACEGRLVPTEAELARADGREYEHGSVLLGRILKERETSPNPLRSRRGLRSPLSARGEGPGVRSQPPPDTSNLPPLPDGWAWAMLGQMVVQSEYGTSVKCTYESGGLPVLRIPNIVAGEMDLSDVKYATVPLHIGAEDALQPGDILMCRTNGSVSLIGKTAVVRTVLEPLHTFASYLLRFRLREPDTLPLWLHIYLTSRAGRAFIESHAASSAGQHNVSLTLIRGMPFPLPPLAEQQRIVAEVERRLSVMQAAETVVAANLKRAERLRQAVLKRAFEGKLVPQGPDDEPASALLERIQAERETSPNPLRARRGLTTSPLRKRRGAGGEV